MANNDCTADHAFFVAEVIGVPEEGKVYLIYVCTACGDARMKDFRVSEPGKQIRLLLEEKQKGK